MSSAVVSTSAAEGRLFLLDEEFVPDVCREDCHISQARRPSASLRDSGAPDPRLAGLTPASRLAIRPAPEMAATGIAPLDQFIGGLPRGCLTEICGPASSGRTSVLLSVLAAATSRGEFCVVVDASDALDPESMKLAGIDLDKLLWVRCGASQPESPPEKNRSRNLSEKPLDQLLRATDMLLESGGFGMIVLDLADVTAQAARRIPLTTWFRFRRVVEHKPTILLVLEQHPIAGSCSSLLLKLSASSRLLSHAVQPTHTQLLPGLEITAEVVRSRLGSPPNSSAGFLDSSLERKPMAAASAAFVSKTAWG